MPRMAVWQGACQVLRRRGAPAHAVPRLCPHCRVGLLSCSPSSESVAALHTPDTAAAPALCSPAVEDCAPRLALPPISLPLIATDGLLASDSWSPAWDGCSDLLVGSGAAPSSPACEPLADSYRTHCQRLAWARGLMWSWAAAACGGPTEARQTGSKPAALPAPITLDEHWNYTFCCLELAARQGKAATYARVASSSVR